MKKVSKVILLLFMVGLFLASSFTKVSVNASERKVYGKKIDRFYNETLIYEDELPNSYSVSTQGFIPISQQMNDNLLTPICPDNVIGTDDRVLVYDASTDPYKKTCRISVSFNENPSQTFHSTGFLVGPSTILTACHSIYDTAYGDGWFDSLTLDFGASVYSDTGQMYYPYGHYTNWTSAQVGNYYNTNDENDDWAIIDLGTNIGNTLGYFGLSASLSNNTTVKTYGYSSDLGGVLTYSYGSATNVLDYKFDHNCDTGIGCSGGPVTKSDNSVVGIHSCYYKTFNPLYETNRACKISVYIVGWIEDRINNS